MYLLARITLNSPPGAELKINVVVWLIVMIVKLGG